jgi:adenosine deaminase
MCTTIGREYALAHALGFTPAELLGFTINAIRASFLPPQRKQLLLAQTLSPARGGEPA